MNLRTMPQELTDAQIEDFLQSWHESNVDDRISRTGLQKDLGQAISEFEAVRELTKNPLLLTALAKLNRYHGVPTQRERLYSKCTDVLLNELDLSRFLTGKDRQIPIDRDDKKAMLRLIAAEMQANAGSLGGNLIGEPRLQEIIKNYLKKIGIKNSTQVAELITEQIQVQDNVLFYLGEGFYSFTHQRFLEYFCAAHFVWLFEKTRQIDQEFLKTHVFSRNGKYSWYNALQSAEISVYEPFSKTLLEEFKTEVFGKYCRDDWWDGVLALIAGSISERFAGEMIGHLIDQDGYQGFQNLFLAAKCLNEVQFRNTIADVDRRLCSLLKHLVISYTTKLKRIRERAIDAIENTWEDNPEVLCWVNDQRHLIGFTRDI